MFQEEDSSCDESENMQMNGQQNEAEPPVQCVVMLKSFLTSNATITLSEFHMNGIRDGYKYVPKAADVEPPYCVKHYIPEMHTNLFVVSDAQLFSQHSDQFKQEIDTEESYSCGLKMCSAEEPLMGFEDPLDVLYDVD
ncbi:Hypothetical predicted protein [Drosophila guanche]|uniref:Uncharacterized protein n=1 Tax=Drosophila guanche TaxID=7266 RepID=A0A3B0JUZ7_DROGU|nr:Hypothetical predicted protein [Drosophila guanche]